MWSAHAKASPWSNLSSETRTSLEKCLESQASIAAHQEANQKDRDSQLLSFFSSWTVAGLRTKTEFHLQLKKLKDHPIVEIFQTLRSCQLLRMVETGLVLEVGSRDLRIGAAFRNHGDILNSFNMFRKKSPKKKLAKRSWKNDLCKEFGVTSYNYYPNSQCMVYLRTFTWVLRANVGKYSIPWLSGYTNVLQKGTPRGCVPGDVATKTARHDSSDRVEMESDPQPKWRTG